MKFPYAIEIVAGAVIAFHAIAASSNEPGTPYTRIADALGARITIGEAIAIAEHHAGGEAIEAELDRKAGKLIYDVDVETDRGDMEVLIDTATGSVLSMEQDD